MTRRVDESPFKAELSVNRFEIDLRQFSREFPSADVRIGRASFCIDQKL